RERIPKQSSDVLRDVVAARRGLAARPARFPRVGPSGKDPFPILRRILDTGFDPISMTRSCDDSVRKCPTPRQRASPVRRPEPGQPEGETPHGLPATAATTAWGSAFVTPTRGRDLQPSRPL